jgi:hypothetical protein
MKHNRTVQFAYAGIAAMLGMTISTFPAFGQGQTAPSGAASAQLPSDAPKPPYRRIVDGPETLNPGAYPAGFPYPDEYDSAVAAPEVHHVRYLDSHIRLVEVAYFPGVHGQMHGHPFPSVFAVDSPVPKGYNINLDPQNKVNFGRGTTAKGAIYPNCRTMSPQAPHAETNQDTWPHHFYRLEFLRVDGKGIQDHWKEWYPELVNPTFAVSSLKDPDKTSKFSIEWPYSISFDSLRAAPANYKLLYEDDHIRLVEFVLRPGETETMEGNPYPSIVAEDAIPGSKLEDKPLDPNHANNPDDVGRVPSPAGFDVPTCFVYGPQTPHALHNTGAVPVHYYRIDFKRIDGDGIKTHWREWYPWMGKLTDEYRAHPYLSNYY